MWEWWLRGTPRRWPIWWITWRRLSRQAGSSKAPRGRSMTQHTGCRLPLPSGRGFPWLTRPCGQLPLLRRRLRRRVNGVPLTITTHSLVWRSLRSPAVRVQPLRSRDLPVIHVTISMTDRVADGVVPFATTAVGVGDHTPKSGVPTPRGVGEPGGVPTSPGGGRGW